MKNKIFYLIFLLAVGCKNDNKKESQFINQLDSLKGANQNIRTYDTTETINSLKKMKNDSITINDFDLYHFENDSLLQSAYVLYSSPREIRFIIKVKNKKSLDTCEYSGTAKMVSGEATAQGNDEMNNDELYGVYEYFTERNPIFTIGVEFKRGKRMTIFTKAKIASCKMDCPLSSVGTLRRKWVSHNIQHNPKW
jgi:hypothetical protein